jgi:hypothetical protein
VAKQRREISKMLDLVNVDYIGLGHFLADFSQQIGAWISQPAHDLPVRRS